MISLNDYLFSGDTVLKILHRYESDLRASAISSHSEIDIAHCNFLLQIISLLERNDFLTYQSQRIREYYKYMTKEYPFLAFTFCGRIKSLIRAEGKFNGYIIEFISDHYSQYGKLPPIGELKQRLSLFRDLIAYRIVLSMPHCHLNKGEDPDAAETGFLYRIAEQIPSFLEERGFTPELVGSRVSLSSPLSAPVRPYYRDYVAEPTPSGYRSLHITFFDNIANCYTELQLRTKQMDDHATIGSANHLSYEKNQILARSRRDIVPQGLSSIFDEAWERQEKLQQLDLSSVDVSMFTAYSQDLINDGCGLYHGRLITPFEHLSRFQNDVID